MRIRKNRIVTMMVAAAMMVAAIVCDLPMDLKAQEWEQPKEFYQTYQNDLVFFPSDTKNGTIYCVMKQEREAESFVNCGWRLTMESEEGCLQTLNLKLGGTYMKKKKTYEDPKTLQRYMLFGITLKNLKKQMNEQVLAAMAGGQCRIRVDACIAMNRNGVYEGSMNEDGTINGRVYCSIEELQKEESCSGRQLEQLKSFYNRQIQKLFSTVSAKWGAGIQSITGAGDYCYGTTCHLNAQVEKGYVFDCWRGMSVSTNPSFSFLVTTSSEWEACTKANQPPEIMAEDLYFSLWEAQNGVITEQELAKWVKAVDEEDGEIAYGISEKNMLILVNYAPSDFLEFRKSGSVSETFRAVDSGGCVVEKTIRVSIVDTAERSGRDAFGQMRFISSKYFEKEAGGLREDSCWMLYPDYKQELKEALEK